MSSRKCVLTQKQCKENKPACDYCAHRGLKCEWPDLRVTQHFRTRDSPSSNSGQPAQASSWNEQLINSDESQELTHGVPSSVHTQGPVFNMLDFRLFNAFVQDYYPHHPIGNDHVWRHEVPCIASDVGRPFKTGSQH